VVWLTSKDTPPDDRYHRSVHADWQLGATLRVAAGDRVVARFDALEVLMVPPTAPRVQRDRAMRVAMRAHRKSGYDFISYDGGTHGQAARTHAMIARRGGRAVGFLVARWRREGAHRVAWADYGTPGARGRAVHDPAPMWSIDFVWVLERARRRGTASRMIETLAAHLEIAVSAFAWGLPLSPDGECLARYLTPGGLAAT
jgi:ribosomal protein S18 acetylase RimI-like enzyme